MLFNFLVQIKEGILYEIIETTRDLKFIASYNWNYFKIKKVREKEKKALINKMKNAVDYEEWKAFAKEYDNLPG